MAKVAREIVEQRPQEIMDACRKLYEKESFQEISLKEISAATGCNLNTVKTRLYTGLKKLRVSLESEV